MKIFLALFVCLFFGSGIFGQTVSDDSSEEPGVEEISLARDDGHGAAGEQTEVFTTTDIPIHCYVGLNHAKVAALKFVVVAVKAENLRPESKIVTVNLKLNGKSDGVNFDASPERIWAAGAYRADIFIDGKLAKSKNFEIKKSAKDSAKVKSAPPAKKKSRKN